MHDERTDILSRTMWEFLSATAAKTATPGGGSVAGIVGALAAALGEMSLNFTRGKKEFAEHRSFHEQLGRRLTRAREMFQRLIDEDMAAYRLWQDSSRMEAGPEKERAVRLAAAAAINVPREMAKFALAVLEDLRSLAEKCNPRLISDVAAGAALAVAALRLCDYNVRSNVACLPDEELAAELRDSSRADLARGVETFQTIERTVGRYLP